MAEVAPAAPKPEEAEKKEEVKKADKKFEFDRPRHIRFLKHCLNVLPSPYLSHIALSRSRISLDFILRHTGLRTRFTSRPLRLPPRGIQTSPSYPHIPFA